MVGGRSFGPPEAGLRIDLTTGFLKENLSFIEEVLDDRRS